MLKDLIQGTSNLVFPPHCFTCKETLSGAASPSPFLCPACLEKIKTNIPPFCPKCSRHLARETSVRCHECQTHPPAFDFAWSACLFDDFLKGLLHVFKYHQKTVLRKPFSRLMIQLIERYHLDVRQFHCIHPIPLSRARLKERGYNQSRLLAEPLARHFCIPLAENIFQRCRDTGHQALLSEKERWTNIKGAFRIKQPFQAARQNILLIDDLLTTGATVSEAARVLKAAGAHTVGVLVLGITR